ncbi:hypothetical protein [Sphingomonas sp. KC8]|uniref:hypothetical protein n=1 Tax=Sphingomonas sp. KC8 TaxID=1030157 RepID=UPI0002EC6B7A|nr:hypothetical protein [Sphingomonas sp. KC8]ARS25870.1 hypothetical protein KC8_00985 [Sphingomonas sp. KC8]
MTRHILLMVVGIGIATALLFGGRDWRFTSRPGVDHVAMLAGKVDEVRLNQLLNDGVVIVPALGDPREGANSPPMLGYSYREVALIGLPFVAYPELGLVLFDETPTGLRAYPLDAETLHGLEVEAGRSFTRDYSFPFYRFMWGWLFVAALAAWLILQMRVKARTRLQSAPV